MATKKKRVRFDQRAIRHWTLYVIKLENDHYYVGITSRKDFMRRIRQHGGRSGARVNRGHAAKEILEIHDLGAITGLRAGRIENDMTLEYRQKFGARRVRGGYDVSKQTPFIPTYTPGSPQSLLLVGVSLLLTIILLAFIILY